MAASIPLLQGETWRSELGLNNLVFVSADLSPVKFELGMGMCMIVMNIVMQTNIFPTDAKMMLILHDATKQCAGGSDCE